MKARLLIAGLVLGAMTLPALSAQFYIVENQKTHKCTVVTKKPAKKTTVTVVGDTVYKTKTEAQDAIKTVQGCNQ